MEVFIMTTQYNQANYINMQKSHVEIELNKARRFLKLTGLSNKYSIAYRSNKSQGEHYALIQSEAGHTKTVAKAGNTFRLLKKFIMSNSHYETVWDKVQSGEDTGASTEDFRLEMIRDFLSAVRTGSTCEEGNRVCLKTSSKGSTKVYSIVEKLPKGHIKTITKANNITDLMNQFLARSIILRNDWSEYCKKYTKGWRYSDNSDITLHFN